MEDLKGVTWVARKLGVSRSWVYAAVKQNRIPYVRIGGPDGPLRFDPHAIDDYIAEARAGWQPSAATLRQAS